MASTPPSTIGHDQAAQLLRMSPGELTKLVNDGSIPRVSPGAYHPGAIIAAYIEYLRAETDRRDRTPSQAEIAAHLDISDRRVRELLTEWDVSGKLSMTEFRLRYVRKLREEAAGRASSGDLDLAQERAALAREQRIRLELINATSRGEFAPISLLTDVLARASASIVSMLDQLDGRISQSAPDMPESTRLAILNTVNTARNECARSTASLSIDDTITTDDPTATEGDLE